VGCSRARQIFARREWRSYNGTWRSGHLTPQYRLAACARFAVLEEDILPSQNMGMVLLWALLLARYPRGGSTLLEYPGAAWHRTNMWDHWLVERHGIRAILQNPSLYECWAALGRLK
jgi:hypothetical protein